MVHKNTSLDMIPWDRFNAVIVTRHSIPELYSQCSKILSIIPYPKVIIPSANTIAHEYVHQCLTIFPQYDWVINIDDDAFITDVHSIYELLDEMDEKGYDYCGMSDGLTYTPRDIFNPASMNPFFNIFHTKTIWQKMSPQTMMIHYHPSLLSKVNFTILHPEIQNRTQQTILQHPFPIDSEPFYPQFFALIAQCKPLFLYGRSFEYDENKNRVGILFPDDSMTTVLYSHKNKPFLLHTWYARSYHKITCPTTPPNNKERIDRIAKYALMQHGLDIV